MIMVVMMFMFVTACGNSMNINGKEYDTQGLFSDRNPKIEYRLIWGNIFWGAVLCETIIAPIYFFGFSIFEPVGIKPAVIDPADVGTVGRKGKI